MRSGDDLALPRVNRNIAHLSDRQIHREWLPMAARVQAEIHRAASTEKQQLGFIRILPHVENEFVFRQTIGDRSPMLTQISSLEDIGLKIVPHVTSRR